MICAGVMWPFEGMPTWLRYISIALPATYPAEAMRAIMGRGKDSSTSANKNRPGKEARTAQTHALYNVHAL